MMQTIMHAVFLPKYFIFRSILFNMDNDSLFKDDFLIKLKEIIEDKIADSQFGVAELADHIGMSRSNLLRKVKKISNLSASQFINRVRLQKAVDLLNEGSLTISEIGFEVGFGSTSYFIKCFREQYGYSPGEYGKQKEEDISHEPNKKNKPKINYITAVITVAGLIILALLFFINPFQRSEIDKEKSIAVLPFINDSNDSSNVYIINGLMEAILNNFQKIENMRVISRTSVEKYRNTNKTIPEIARELNVSYFVEGSGQKVGNKILLNVQLIDADNDKHLWAAQYKREVKDIFELQNNIAQTIANEVQVIITPEEKQRIERIPTDNLEAYDNYLKGLEYIRNETGIGLKESIIWFKKAIDHDSEFAEAYAYIAIAYYYMDVFQADKQHLKELNEYADKAMLYNSGIPESLIAKGLFYMNSGEYAKALPHFEKAHKYSPNSAWIINFLSDFYTTYQPDTQKYLEYALKGERLHIATNDSATTSILYLHLSNSLIQNAFVDQALKYINKALDYNPDNISAYYVKAYILFGIHKDLNETKDLLLETYKMDTTRLDVLQEVGKLYYMLGDYKSSYKYYKKFDHKRIQYQMDIFWYENIKISYVFDKNGDTARATELFEIYKTRASQDESIYKDVMLSASYIIEGDLNKAIEYLKKFSEYEHYHYWTILFYKLDPLSKEIQKHPDFDKVWKKIEKNFWKDHNQIEEVLKEKNLL